MERKTEPCLAKARETEIMLARMRGEMERQGSSPQDLLWVMSVGEMASLASMSDAAGDPYFPDPEHAALLGIGVQAVSGIDQGDTRIDLSYAAERYGSAGSGAALSRQHEAES